MASVVKVFKTLRNHWKKSIFATVLLTYGSNYFYKKYRMLEMMRAYCEEAKDYGNKTIPVFVKPRHVTVILNPAAQNGKGKKLYESFSAPLLHLAGLKVSVVQTEHEGQAKDLMEIMENTDAVIIAGGNGTLHEAVTGLLRRKDVEEACQMLPIGIVPVGKKNTVAKNLFWASESTQAQFLADATMAVIRETKRPLDVMKIEGEKGKPVFSLSHFEFGVIRDASVNVEKYWYLGPLKAVAAFTFRSMRMWPVEDEVTESYILPCSGCSRCYQIEKQKQTSNRRWWHAFMPRRTLGTDVKPSIDFSQIKNENCGVWHENIIHSSNLAVYTDNILSKKEDNIKSLHVKVHPSSLGRLDFISEALSHQNDSVAAPSALATSHDAQEMKLRFNIPDGEERWCGIDNENYEVQPIDIILFPNKVYVYGK